MAVLSREFLNSGNCYISFADLPAEIDLETFRGFGKEHGGEVFFEFPESLLETYCSITRSYSMFDPHSPTQFKKPHDVRKIAGEMLCWAGAILRCPTGIFGQHLDLYDTIENVSNVTEEEMRKDLIDTILFLVERITSIAAKKRVLAFDGV